MYTPLAPSWNSKTRPPVSAVSRIQYVTEKLWRVVGLLTHASCRPAMKADTGLWTWMNASRFALVQRYAWLPPSPLVSWLIRPMGSTTVASSERFPTERMTMAVGPALRTRVVADGVFVRASAARDARQAVVWARVPGVARARETAVGVGARRVGVAVVRGAPRPVAEHRVALVHVRAQGRRAALRVGVIKALHTITLAVVDVRHDRDRRRVAKLLGRDVERDRDLMVDLALLRRSSSTRGVVGCKLPPDFDRRDFAEQVVVCDPHRVLALLASHRDYLRELADPEPLAVNRQGVSAASRPRPSGRQHCQGPDCVVAGTRLEPAHTGVVEGEGLG
eukprot:2305220-Rhodomonas_salina.1